MCGFLAIINSQDKKSDLIKGEIASKKLRHRGPDEEGVFVSEKNHLLFHKRLSIMDVKTGRQPIALSESFAVIHNGEIYNHRELAKTYKFEKDLLTSSDSESIIHLYKQLKEGLVHHLDGVFAFVLIDGDDFLVARDPIGVKPLYYGKDKDGALWFASEAKAIEVDCEEVIEFPPGHYYDQKGKFVEYYAPKWRRPIIPTDSFNKLKDSFEKAVEKRLMSDVEVGVLLSGGLDSSLVASVMARKMKGKKLKSFSVGLDVGSTDLGPAKKVAEFLGTEHHEVTYSIEEGLAHIEEMIYKLETYDITTIRASTPMLIMSKYIINQGVKVVLSGEGSDEIFGGYLYFHNAPDKIEFHRECVRRVNLLYTSDVLRADRATMGAGVEARVPFLDLEFLETAMAIDPDYKMIKDGQIEKYVLRKAFDDQENPYLPEEVLWRQKEQFSDGVGYGWIDSLKEIAERKVSDDEFSKREELFPVNTPKTKEAFLYRSIFERLFQNRSMDKLTTPWVPKWQENDDPSGRANKFHKATNEPKKNDELAVVS